MKTQTWLETLKEGKGKEISRIWFCEYANQEGVTSLFNPLAYNRWLNRKDNKKTPHYVLPIVNYYYQIWYSRGFFQKSVPMRKIKGILNVNSRKKLRYVKNDYSLFILNFEPIYKFFKEKGQIDFTDKEKEFFESLMLNDDIRKKIIGEFPDDDIISATLNFYIKNFINRYLFLLRDIEENQGDYLQEIQRVNDINNPRKKSDKEAIKYIELFLDNFFKKMEFENKRKGLKFKIIRYISAKNVTTPIELMFLKYVNKIEEEQELVLSLDRKILKASGIYPNDILKYKLSKDIK